MKNYTYIVLILLFIFIGVLRAQSIEIMADTDSSEYYVGDYIKYKIVIKHDKNITVKMPSVRDSISNLDYIKELPADVHDVNGRVIELYRYVFSKYDSSEVTIPSFNINFQVTGEDKPHTIKTNPVTILIKTMEVDTKGDIQDVKSPLRIPLDWWMILLYSLVLIALITGGYFGYKYFKKKQEGIEISVPKVIIPPHKIAIKALMELEEKKLWQQGEVKEYHSQITGIIRKYFEDRFNFLALEMPSSEVLRGLSEIPEAGVVFDLTREFLENADMVKFAKFQPMPTVNEEMMKQAYEIVNKTKKKEQLFEEEEVAENV